MVSIDKKEFAFRYVWVNVFNKNALDNAYCI